MPNYTQNLGLYTPVLTDEFGGDFLPGLTENFKALDGKIHENLLSTPVENVVLHGAVDDGSSDNTAAFQEAIDAIDARGGGTLLIPNLGNSVYKVDGEVVLCDNLTIRSNGAVLKKTDTSTSYKIFFAKSGAKQGYGAGASNLLFEGLIVEGDYVSHRGANISLHHSDNAIFRNCVFRKSVVSGHSIDLGGCSNITVQNCVFKGFDKRLGREYVEAIQVDFSLANGLSNDDPAGYDGLPCKNITVDNCTFEPYDGYPAPNAFGMHSKVEGMIHKDIKFTNNHMEGGIPSPTGSESTFAVGWIHFFHVDGLEVSGNTFVNTVNGQESRLIGFYNANNAIPLSEVANPNPTEVAYVSGPCDNVMFANNVIRGFNGTENSRLIFIQGDLERYFLNHSYLNNTFVDCYDTSAASDDVSSDLIYGYHIFGLKVAGNTCNSVRKLLDIQDAKQIHFKDNQLRSVYWSAITASAAEDLIVDGNTLEDFGIGMYFSGGDRIKVLNNIFRTEHSSVFASYNQVIALSGCTRFNITGNDFLSTKGVEQGIHIYDLCDNGDVYRNIITGATYDVVISSDSTNVRR